MKITTNYDGTCTKCRAKIWRGEIVEWTRGKGVKHIDCSAPPKVKPVPARRATLDPEYVRDEAEYQAGLADGRRASAERAIYGSELAEQFDIEDELARYNRGDD